jgi:long-chain acyl-CoA synthetase
VLSHGNYRQVTRMCEDFGVIEGEGEVVYLYLPLAHSYALLIQLLAIDLGGTIAYWSGDPQQIVPDLMAVKPGHLPSVPRIFEKIYTLVTSNNDPEKIKAATQLGLKVRRMQEAGQEVPAQLQAAFDKADAELYANVRNIFGGNLKQANSGAAPIGREILEFFYACGAPVLEGYGMTETSTVTTTSTVADHKLGTVGRAIPGSEIRIADDGEILVRGPHIFKGYYGTGDTTAFGAVDPDGWLHTGDLGDLDDEGYLTITGRKKDIMITAGGKNLTPANLENDLKRSRWISQAVMHADRRPFPVALITLDPEEIVHFAREHNLPEENLHAEPKVIELIQSELDRVNANYARVEQIKRFFILDHDLSQETGELTPTLKVKRNVVNEKYAAEFDALYK